MTNLNNNYQNLPEYLKEMISNITGQEDVQEVYLYTEKLKDISGLKAIENGPEVVLEVINRHLVCQVKAGLIGDEFAETINTSVEEAINEDLLLYVSQAEAQRVFDVSKDKITLSDKHGLTGPYAIDGKEYYEWSELRKVFYLSETPNLEFKIQDDLFDKLQGDFFNELLNNPIEMFVLLESFVKTILTTLEKYDHLVREYNQLEIENQELHVRHQQDRQTIKELKRRGVS